MAKKKGFQKSIEVYISRLKKMPGSLSHLTSTPTSSSSRLFSSCKYPKTPSIAANCADDNAAATLSDVDRFLHENFRSLFRSSRNTRVDKFFSESPRRHTDQPVRKLDRFFASQGSTSGSLREDAGGRLSALSDSTSPPMSLSSSCGEAVIAGGGVKVTTISMDPYEDFRRSMQDMMDARHVEDLQPLDWEFMEELLFCYLELNNRKVHKYILRAFADLTVSFRVREEEKRRRLPARRKKFIGPAAVALSQRTFPAGR